MAQLRGSNACHTRSRRQGLLRRPNTSTLKFGSDATQTPRFPKHHVGIFDHDALNRLFEELWRAQSVRS